MKWLGLLGSWVLDGFECLADVVNQVPRLDRSFVSFPVSTSHHMKQK